MHTRTPPRARTRPLLAAFALAWLCAPHTLAQSEPGFSKHQVDQYLWLNDFVLVDLNNDGRLDIASSNHALKPRIRLNTGTMRFQPPQPESPLAFFDHLPELIPGLDTPDMTKDGIYIFHTGLWVRIVAKGLTHPPGNLVITDTSKEAQPSFAIINTTGASPASPPTRVNDKTQHTITLGADFDITLAPTQPTLRFFADVEFPQNIATDTIHLGPRGRPAESHTITLDGFSDTDWHNTIWADFNNDTITDLFVAQGGDNGQASPDSTVYNDRLFLSTNQTPLADDRAYQTGIRKLGMPARGAMIADIDNNGLPDIYVRNARPQGANKPIRNTLHMQTEPLRFQEQAEQYKLDITTKGIGAWFDPDDDGDPDLLWADQHSIRLFVNKLTHFEPTTIATGVTHSSWISIADFDNDADLDAAIACWPTQLILVNTDGKLDPVPATSFGLPKSFNAAHWLDADNDGKLDLYAPPSGLYLQRDNQRFINTSLLRTEPGWDPFAWGDLNNDGRLDLVRRTDPQPEQPTITQHTDIAGQSVEVRQAPAYTLTAYTNQLEPTNHWLELTLIGPPHNRSAIGTTVLLEHHRRKQLTLVGQQNASQSSMGNTRIHLGLGTQSPAPGQTTLTINWPDGTTTRIDHPQANTHHTIRYPETAPLPNTPRSQLP